MLADPEFLILGIGSDEGMFVCLSFSCSLFDPALWIEFLIFTLVISGRDDDKVSAFGNSKAI
jgi:hypothetical protein